MKQEDFSFNKSSPFYDLVGTFTTALMGFQAFSLPGNPMGWKESGVLRLEGKVSEPLAANFFKHYKLVQNGHLNQAMYFASLSCMLMNTAYETVKDKNDQTPEFEFFRHIRNASSHGNRFFFTDYEPKRPAIWRRITIDDSVKGKTNPLFGKVCFFDFFAVPDALLLLSDIDTKIT